MLSQLIHFLIRLFLFSFLTVLTQIGGLVYISAFLLFRKRSLGIRALGFIGVYIVTSFIMVPLLAKAFGREKIAHTELVRPANYFTVLCNRNYVSPVWNDILGSASEELDSLYPGIQVQYLDANFPFINGFPLFPHLSHDDGKKLDLSFLYEEEGRLTNKKPSWSGYGHFEGPQAGEIDTNLKCKGIGYWQYDYAKYLALLSNKDLDFTSGPTSELINLFLNNKKVKKIFLEPHLKERLGIKSNRVRFHGCHAVRHDDHIHLEL